MTSPLAGKLVSYRLNRTLHGRSAYRKADVPGHNCIRYYYSPGRNDALDAFCPAGTPVNAPHAGHITRIADPGGRLSAIYIVGDGAISCLAHLSLKAWVKVGVWVEEGRVIGYVGRKLKDPHLHFELEFGGGPIVAATPRRLAERMQRALDNDF